MDMSDGADWWQQQQQEEEQQYLLLQLEKERVIYPAIYAQAEREMGFPTRITKDRHASSKIADLHSIPET